MDTAIGRAELSFSNFLLWSSDWMAIAIDSYRCIRGACRHCYYPCYYVTQAIACFARAKLHENPEERHWTWRSRRTGRLFGQLKESSKATSESRRSWRAESSSRPGWSFRLISIGGSQIRAVRTAHKFDWIAINGLQSIDNRLDAASIGNNYGGTVYPNLAKSG